MRQETGQRQPGHSQADGRQHPAGAPQEIAVDLTALDDGKAPEDWTAAELDAAARDAAFDAEVEEFCLALLTGTYPADFTPEDGAAESEASAE